MGRVAVSISHESDYAVAIAYGVRTAGGRFLYPPDIEERMDEREAVLMKRFERLRSIAKEVASSLFPRSVLVAIIAIEAVIIVLLLLRH